MKSGKKGITDMAMRYELTADLMTGNTLIDTEHKQLFDAINGLMDACAEGKGRDKIMSTAQFLESYVGKHFADEEGLQAQNKYPAYPSHKQFHDGYKRQLKDTVQVLVAEGPTVKALGTLNQIVGVLVSHIRTEDKKLARFLRGE